MEFNGEAGHVDALVSLPPNLPVALQQPQDHHIAPGAPRGLPPAQSGLSPAGVLSRSVLLIHCMISGGGAALSEIKRYVVQQQVPDQPARCLGRPSPQPSAVRSGWSTGCNLLGARKKRGPAPRGFAGQSHRQSRHGKGLRPARAQPSRATSACQWNGPKRALPAIANPSRATQG